MQILETDIEKPVCDYAQKYLGYFVFKLAFISFTGAPDRIFIREGGVIVFGEFKRPGKTAKKRQTFVHQILKQCGFPVYVMDNKAQAIKILKIHAERVSKNCNKKRTSK